MRARHSQRQSWAANLLLALFAAFILLVLPHPASAGVAPPVASRTAQAAPLPHLQLVALSCRRGEACLAGCHAPLPAASTAPDIRGRIFVQDTPPPSLEALRAERFASIASAKEPQLPRSSGLRQTGFAVANRQRAP